MQGFSTTGNAVYATNSSGNGVYASSLSGIGVYGQSSGFASAGVRGFSNGGIGIGVYGQSSGGASSIGVYGTSNFGHAGVFDGAVQVNGVLSKSAGSFKIDDPLDPATSICPTPSLKART